jgi:L-ribulose-5-phosphate 4-epimerase
MYHRLKQRVYEANMELQRYGLVVFTWGNVSAIDRDDDVIAIKPSGVSYADLTPESIVILRLDGTVVEGDLRPSSDTPTHLELYRSFAGVGGICHTHSTHATMWAQAQREIPCLGTTHADHFYGAIPVTETMTAAEIEADYEANTGRVIVRRFEALDPMQVPAVLVANHGPFTWGDTAAASVVNAVVLEEVAKMACGALAIRPDQKAVSQALLDKHYLRKHGDNAYYGQT